jgi:hypothetical protein
MIDAENDRPENARSRSCESAPIAASTANAETSRPTASGSAQEKRARQGRAAEAFRNSARIAAAAPD